MFFLDFLNQGGVWAQNLRKWAFFRILPPMVRALRSRINEDPHRNAPEILIIPSCAPDLGEPQKRNLSSGSPRTVTCAQWRTNHICRISVIVAPFELVFGVCAQFCCSGLLFQLIPSTFLTMNLT